MQVAASAAAAAPGGDGTQSSLESAVSRSTTIAAAARHMSRCEYTGLQEQSHASPAFQRRRFLAFAIMVTGCKFLQIF